VLLYFSGEASRNPEPSLLLVKLTTKERKHEMENQHEEESRAKSIRK
jgi:hypothetical protein